MQLIRPSCSRLSEPAGHFRSGLPRRHLTEFCSPLASGMSMGSGHSTILANESPTDLALVRSPEQGAWMLNPAGLCANGHTFSNTPVPPAFVPAVPGVTGPEPCNHGSEDSSGRKIGRLIGVYPSGRLDFATYSGVPQGPSGGCDCEWQRSGCFRSNQSCNSNRQCTSEYGGGIVGTCQFEDRNQCHGWCRLAR